MNFVDLMDADYRFNCQIARDACEYWNYDLSVERWDDKYIRNLSQSEIEQLARNCNNILNAISCFQGGKHD